MSEFYSLLDEYIGEADDISDIRAVVRRCWFYDFKEHPLRVWQGKGKLFTADGNEWLGTIDANNQDHHKTPAIKDGRDGSSIRYEFGLKLPGSQNEIYENIKKDQWRVIGQTLTCFMAIFKVDEGLRPSTPIVYFQQFNMMNSKFSEKISIVDSVVVKNYEVSIVCKDGNFGRSEIPNGTYANAIQQERAKQLGVDIDLGSQFVAGFANRTYTLP